MSTLEEARKIIGEVDEKMASLFVRRMEAVKLIAAYKKEHGLPIFDEQREKELIAKNSESLHQKELSEYYVKFLQETINLSKEYQKKLIDSEKND